MRKKNNVKKKAVNLKFILAQLQALVRLIPCYKMRLAQRARGLDVVVGVAESHGRKEIESLLENLEILPRQVIDYHGKQLS